MNNKKGSLAGFTSQRSRLIIWGVIGLVLMSNLGAIIDSFLHPEIEYFDLEHIIVGGATALVFGIMFLMITRYLDRFEKTVSDISQSEKALRESEEKLKTIIETSPDGIATSTLDGKIQFVTEKLVSIFGYASTDELIGRNVMEFVHSSDREKIGLLINELLNGHLTGPAECLLVKKDGSLFYAEANANILCDAGKNPIGILYLERNITERKKAEALLRESEERYRLLHDSSLDGIMLTAPDGRIFSANASACHMLGRTEEEIIQAGRNGVVDTTDPNLALAIEERSRTGKFIGELAFIRKSGEKFPVEVSSSLFTDEDGNIKTSLTFHDITERKQAEDKLRESEERYRFLTNNIPDIIYSLDGEGKIVTVNSPAFEHYGYTEQDSKGKPFLNFVHPEDREIVIGSFLKALEEQRKITQGLQFRIVAENGFSFWFELNSQARFDSQGQYTGEEGVLRDITERKQAEERLQNSEAFLNRIIEQSPLAMWVSDDEGNLIRVNQACCDLLNVTEQEVFGRYNIFQDNLFSEQGFMPQVRAVFESGETAHFELNYDSSLLEGLNLQHTVSVFLDITIFPIKDTSDRITHAVIQYDDITERKHAEKALRESESRLYLATSAGNIGIWDWNVVKNELIWDDSMYSLYGIHKDDFGGAYEAWTRTLHPDDRQYIDETIQVVLRGEQEYAPEFRVVRADGAIRIFKAAAQTMRDQNGSALRMIGINYDITERKQAEEEVRKLNAMLEQRVEERTRELRDAQEQLVRHEKLSVLGQMASSVGHELRNPLAVITSALYYLRLVQPNADEKIKQYLGMIEQEVRTSEKIISDLLDFARVKSVDREAVSVSDLICRTLERFPVPESVQSILDIPADLPQVYVDPRQMTQVLGNLVVNACQAMAAVRSGGKLSIIGNIQNNMIIIVVKDNGTGISPENMKKIFDPLFTTKVKGIGLGLAVSQKLVDANGGSIQVESEAGVGSAFTVSLPIHHPRV